MDYEINEIWEAMKNKKYDITKREISEIIRNSDLNSENYLEATLSVVVEAVHAQAGTIWEMCTDGMIRAKYSYHGENLDGIALKPGSGIAGSVISTGKPVLIENCRNDRQWNKEVDGKTGFETRTMICVPIKADGRISACVQLINRIDDLPFYDNDVELVKSIADSIAGIYAKRVNDITEPLFLGRLILNSGSEADIVKKLAGSKVLASMGFFGRLAVKGYIKKLNRLLRK